LAGGVTQRKDQVIGRQRVRIVGIGPRALGVGHLGIQIQPLAVLCQQQLAAQML
jgi:hypothetical protein